MAVQSRNRLGYMVRALLADFTVLMVLLALLAGGLGGGIDAWRAGESGWYSPDPYGWPFAYLWRPPDMGDPWLPAMVRLRREERQEQETGKLEIRYDQGLYAKYGPYRLGLVDLAFNLPIWFLLLTSTSCATRRWLDLPFRPFQISMFTLVFLPLIGVMTYMLGSYGTPWTRTVLSGYLLYAMVCLVYTAKLVARYAVKGPRPAATAAR